jgi:flagellar biosynthesis/type III secretory pathway M-ring protein FliF/YscJ
VRDVFPAEKEAAARASVRLQLERGKKLSKTAVLGIAKLVASAVEHLKPENVTITDTQDNLYEVPKEEAPYTLSAELLELKRKAEEQFEQKALGALAFLRRKIVKANVVLENEDKIVEETRYEEGGLASEETERERNLETKGVPRTTTEQMGIAERLATIPTTPSLPMERKRSSATYHPKLPTTRSTSTIRPGWIKDKTISVVVPVEVAALAPGEDRELTAQEIAQRTTQINQNLKSWAEIVAKACGIDDLNKIKVAAVSFAKPVPLPPPTTWELIGKYLSRYGGKAFLAILALVAVFLIYRVVKRGVPEELAREIERLRRELEAEVPITPEMREAEARELRIAQMRRRIRDMVQKSPRTAALLLKRWVTKG